MKYDINIDRSADFSLTFTLKDASGSVVNLTGATIRAQMREYAESTDSVSFETSHTGSGGCITISLSHEDTTDVSWSHGVYDVFVTYSGGTVENVLAGEVCIYSNTTRLDDGSSMRVISFGSYDDFPATGRSDRLYLATDENKLYRWSGNAYVYVSSNGVQWGDIIGTLSNQTDLNNVLNLKANTADLGALAFLNSISLGGSNATGTLPISKGGTGANSAADARTNLGLSVLAVSDDAPSDGLEYVRKNGEWAPSSAEILVNPSSDGFYGLQKTTVNNVTNYTWVKAAKKYYTSTFYYVDNTDDAASDAYSSIQSAINAIAPDEIAFIYVRPSSITYDADGVLIDGRNATIYLGSTVPSRSWNVTGNVLTGPITIKNSHLTINVYGDFIVRTSGSGIISTASTVYINNAKVSNPLAETLYIRYTGTGSNSGTGISVNGGTMSLYNLKLNFTGESSSSTLNFAMGVAAIQGSFFGGKYASRTITYTGTKVTYAFGFDSGLIFWGSGNITVASGGFANLVNTTSGSTGASLLKLQNTEAIWGA